MDTLKRNIILLTKILFWKWRKIEITQFFFLYWKLPVSIAIRNWNVRRETFHVKLATNKTEWTTCWIWLVAKLSSSASRFSLILHVTNRWRQQKTGKCADNWEAVWGREPLKDIRVQGIIIKTVSFAKNLDYTREAVSVNWTSGGSWEPLAGAGVIPSRFFNA